MSTFRKDRRRFMTALGLGAGSLFLPSRMGGRSQTKAQETEIPTRILFFLTPHGMTPPFWHMRQEAMLAADHELDLTSMAEGDFAQIFRPLYRHRQKLLLLDNLTQATSIRESGRVRDGIGHDANEHHLSQAHLMTGTWTVQRDGSTAIGGGRSLDLHIADSVGQPGRFANRIYGFRHQHPYSFLGPNEPAPREQNPSTAFADMMGYLPTDPGMDTGPTREDLLRAGRGSALDFAAAEFDHVLPRLGREDADKLRAHQQLIRELELSFSGVGGTPSIACDPDVTISGNEMTQFMQLATLAFSCDVTRVVTLVARGLQPADFGAPTTLNMHQDIAHNSTENAGGYDPLMAQYMADYYTAYANQFAELLDHLDAVPEGDGTVLDHTCVVWLTELSTGTHWRDRMPCVVAGGANGYFDTGRYVYYAPTNTVPFSYGRASEVGPADSHLRVSLMHAMGLTDQDWFGLEEIDIKSTGEALSLRGPLPRLTA